MSAVAFPGPVVRRKIKAIPKRRGLSIGKVASFFAFVVFLAVLLKVGMTFFGFMLIEEARRSASESMYRAKLAESSAIELRREIEELRSEEKIVRWASINNFQPAFSAVHESAN